MKETIFLTGGTGLLGSYMVNRLLRQKNPEAEKIILLCRGKSQQEAEARMRGVLGGMSRIEVLRGDVAEENLGISPSAYKRLAKEVNLIYHSAALCEFGAQLGPIRKANVGGTRNVLALARECRRAGRFKCLHHISTVAVAGDRHGVVYENELDCRQEFNNTYEQSKFEAEKAVEEARAQDMPAIIYRPSIIVGDSRTGHTNNFKMLYQPLHLFCMELYRSIPADRSTCFSFSPVDYVAEAIVRISRDSRVHDYGTYHVSNPNETTFAFFIDAASRYFGFKKPEFLKPDTFPYAEYSPLQQDLLKPFVPYFNYRLHFDTRNACAILDKTGFRWPKMDAAAWGTLFKYCLVSGFIKPKKQT